LDHKLIYIGLVLRTNIKGIPSQGLVGKNFQPEKKREILCTGTTNTIVSVDKYERHPLEGQVKTIPPKNMRQK